MQNIKTCDLNGRALDFAVSLVLHPDLSEEKRLSLVLRDDGLSFRPTETLTLGLELCRDHHINVRLRKLGKPADANLKWSAQAPTQAHGQGAEMWGPDHNTAAMRAFVVAHHGHIVCVPTVLLKEAVELA